MRFDYLLWISGLKNVVAAVEWAVRCELTAEVDAALQQQHVKGQQQQQQQHKHRAQQLLQQQQRHSLNIEPISSQHMQHVNAMFLAGEPFSPE
jgi:transcription initiation factor TFIID subunit TAF12